MLGVLVIVCFGEGVELLLCVVVDKVCECDFGVIVFDNV